MLALKVAPADYWLPVWHVYWNGVHVLGPVTRDEAWEKHLVGPNDSRIVREESATLG